MWFQTIKDSIVWLSSVFPNNPDLHNSVILCVSKTIKTSTVLLSSVFPNMSLATVCRGAISGSWLFEYSPYLHPYIYSTVLIYILLFTIQYLFTSPSQWESPNEHRLRIQKTGLPTHGMERVDDLRRPLNSHKTRLCPARDLRFFKVLEIFATKY